MFSLMQRRPERAVARRGFEPFLTLRENMESLFDRFVEGWHLPEAWTELRDWEMEETDKEVVMRLALPGFEANAIEVRAEGNVCVVRAEHPEVKEEKETNGRRHAERFEHRFVMPFGTDVNHVEANYRNGILELHLPRLPEMLPKRIEVKT
jgi:HSP20 family protein